MFHSFTSCTQFFYYNESILSLWQEWLPQFDSHNTPNYLWNKSLRPCLQGVCLWGTKRKARMQNGSVNGSANYNNLLPQYSYPGAWSTLLKYTSKYNIPSQQKRFIAFNRANKYGRSLSSFNHLRQHPNYFLSIYSKQPWYHHFQFALPMIDIWGKSRSNKARFLDGALLLLGVQLISAVFQGMPSVQSSGRLWHN